MVKESNLKFKMGVHTRKMTVKIIFCIPMVKCINYSQLYFHKNIYSSQWFYCKI